MGVPGKRTVSRAGYSAYIQSPEWRAVRQRYFASGMPQECYVCGTPRKPGMHLHHRTYKNLGAERLMDLVPVCPGCHELIHAIFNSNRPYWEREGLWFATKKARMLVQKRTNPIAEFGANLVDARKRYRAAQRA
ncbi:5-methylcytosine-specific restriction endonuclease McrA [Leifsonia sp. 563]|uniref:HNH endonuclease signature motif containing protein n=1 Tax=Leifsonia sp. 563 TaxID=3156412 RepID=UPI003394CE60